MRLRIVAAIGSVALGMFLFPASLPAQFRSRGFGEGGRSFDPTEMLRGMDTNKNGQIEPAEMSSNRAAFFVRGAAQRAGMDLTKPLPIANLVEAMQRSREERSRDGDRGREDRGRDDRRRDDDRRSDGDRPSSSQPGLPPTAGPPSGVATFGSAPPAGSAVTSFGSDGLEQRYEARVITYVDDMLNRYDTNKDGYIDSNEWKANRWSTPPEESDLNKDNRLSREELCVRIAKRFGSPAGGNSSASSTGSSAGDNGEQIRRYAESMLRQYDRDSDGKLSREEWSAMPSQHHTADTNSDGTITAEELGVKLANYAGGGVASTGSALGGRSPAMGTVRRFLTPAERLPAGLPSWFLEKDANQDGQLMMSEFAARWSNETAAEFSRSDLNGDGIITAKECLKAESAPK